MCKTNNNFEKFQNPVNLIYTVCANSDMVVLLTFTIVSMVRPTGVEISEKPKVAKTNCHFEKFQNNVYLIHTVCAMSEMII